MKSKKKNKNAAIEEALRLICDPRLLCRVGQKIGDLGVVGEERNRLIVVLAGIGRTLPEPPSVMTKGPTASGKSTSVKKALQIFPPDCVIERAGLSSKALAHGHGSLANKILFITEYRCGKDAQLLLRLIQSEGRINHEYTTIRGAHRGTRTAKRTGMPTVLTTTTDDKVFADDESRFQSIHVDESPAQTLAILQAQARGPKPVDKHDLAVWQSAMALLKRAKGDFQHPPAWLQYVAEQLPLTHVRARRDWEQFLSFCQACALCRRGVDAVLDITFADY
jgi:hypothetical protein